MKWVLISCEMRDRGLMRQLTTVYININAHHHVTATRQQEPYFGFVKHQPNIHNMSTHTQRDFLNSVLSLPLASSSPGRPHVTLTYAQSLDGCIAGVGRKQLLLSGQESMVMTHW